MSSHATPALLRGLVDDAAVFPPGLAPMPQAVLEHRQHRAAWYSELVGPLLVPVVGLGTFAQSLADGEQDRPMRVSLIGDATQTDPLPGLLGAVSTLGDPAAEVPAEVVAVELPARRDDQVADVRRIAAALDQFLPDGVQAWVEVHRGPDLPDALAALADAPSQVAAKFRTGGVEARFFPSTGELAAVLHSAVEVRVPLKLTAGLHHAVRHTADETGFTHHGFGNVLAAVAAAQAGGSVAELDDVLGTTAPSPLVERLASLDDEAARAVRSTFVSFGCCGVTDPVDDLVGLGLLAAPSTASAPTAKETP